MKPVPHAEVEQLAKAQYRQKFEQAPAPTVINVEPLVALHAPRAFQWDGIGYRVPPVSYPAGVRCLVAANAIHERRVACVSPAVMRPVLRTAARVIRGVIRPASAFVAIVHALRRCPFTHGDPAAVEGLLRWLIDAPDQSPVIIPTEAVTVDLVDGLASFTRAFPAWIGADGWPLSYAHYLYGTRHLGRLAAREDLRQATATRMAGADKDGWKPWADELRSAAGW